MKKEKHKEENMEKSKQEADNSTSKPLEILDENAEGNEQQTENETSAEETAQQPDFEQQAIEMKDKYLRLSAEFDNYRKRTLREKAELIKYSSENVLTDILPVIDDFERAMKTIEQATDIEAVKEGISLIYNKFIDLIKQKGLKEIESMNSDFNTDFHESIAKVPVNDKSLSGKIIEVIQKGYMLDDKVVRYAKVIVGE